jgi:hypothetical protein
MHTLSLLLLLALSILPSRTWETDGQVRDEDTKDEEVEGEEEEEKEKEHKSKSLFRFNLLL